MVINVLFPNDEEGNRLIDVEDLKLFGEIEETEE